MAGTMPDTGAPELRKTRCLPSRSSHNLEGAQARHWHVTVVIPMTEVAARTNFHKAERVNGQVQAWDHTSSAASCHVVGI